MIADLGVAQQLSNEVTSNSTVYGMPEYIEPQHFENESYVIDKKSDIYSLGVLLWEITSGYPPFLNTSIYALITKIVSGFREQPIADTPPAYIRLYQKCWDDNPNIRPTVDDVFDVLTLQCNINNKDNPTVAFNAFNGSNSNLNYSQSQSSKSTNVDD